MLFDPASVLSLCNSIPDWSDARRGVVRLVADESSGACVERRAACSLRKCSENISKSVFDMHCRGGPSLDFFPGGVSGVDGAGAAGWDARCCRVGGIITPALRGPDRWLLSGVTNTVASLLEVHD